MSNYVVVNGGAKFPVFLGSTSTFYDGGAVQYDASSGDVFYSNGRLALDGHSKNEYYADGCIKFDSQTGQRFSQSGYRLT